MSRLLERLWYGRSPLAWLLWPLSGLYRLLVVLHRLRQPTPWRPPVPVIVVGNLSVGGTGKTPICLALAQHYRAQGRRVVILSRGYRGKAADQPRVVGNGADPHEVGDEAVLLAQHSGCPVVVDRQRARAARHAVEHLGADLLLSDDGLQHHALGRHAELVVIDGQRGFGNGLLLPAGPLREPLTRLRTVDAVVVNGEPRQRLPVGSAPVFTIALHPTELVNLQTGQRLSPAAWHERLGGKSVHAVAGIGNPERFFQALRELGFAIMPHAFADHHDFRAQDLAFAMDAPLLMTAKDAVKCRSYAQADWWYLDVTVTLPAGLLAIIDSTLRNRHAR